MLFSVNTWLMLFKIPGRFIMQETVGIFSMDRWETSGKLTADSVEPLSEYFANLLATSNPIFS